MRNSVNRSAVRNQLLAALSPIDFERLQKRLQPVSLPLHEVVNTPGRPVDAVYFLESGFVSMVALLEDGDMLEVGLVGREGLVGLSVILGSDTVVNESLVQLAGSALRIEANALSEEMDASPGLRSLLLRYVQAFYAHVSQTAACNGRHTVPERLARWLLMAHDRAEGDEFPMTQQFLSLMLGVRRSGVTVSAGTLQRAGLIRFGGGRVEVTQRAGLEAAACECYRLSREQTKRIMGPAAGR
jgi:CRP-like cAMP-binding protein